MRVDLHVHSSYSRDCLATPEAIIAACRRHGVDKIGLTDHNTIRGALALQKMAPDLVIVGEEIKTTAGELIAYYVGEEVPAGLEPAEAIRRLRQQGAVVGISHPLDRVRREAMGLDNTLALIEQVDFLETFNSRVLVPSDNQRAAALAIAHGLPGTAGSDAHHAGHVGLAYVEMASFADRDGFLDSLRQGRVDGRLSGLWVHFISTFAKLRRRSDGGRA